MSRKILLLLVAIAIVVGMVSCAKYEGNPIQSLADIYGEQLASEIMQEHPDYPRFSRSYKVQENLDIFWVEDVVFDDETQCFRLDFGITTSKVRFSYADYNTFFQVKAGDEWMPCPTPSEFNQLSIPVYIEQREGIDILRNKLLCFYVDNPFGFGEQQQALPHGYYRAFKEFWIADDMDTGIGKGYMYLTAEFTIPER